MTIRTRPYFDIFHLSHYNIPPDFTIELLDIISDSHISYGNNEETFVSHEDFFQFVDMTLEDWDNDEGSHMSSEKIADIIQIIKREFEEYDSAHPDLEDIAISLGA